MHRLTTVATFLALGLTLLLTCATPAEAGWFRRTRRECCVPCPPCRSEPMILLYCDHGSGTWQVPSTPEQTQVATMHPASDLGQICTKRGQYSPAPAMIRT